MTTEEKKNQELRLLATRVRISNAGGYIVKKRGLFWKVLHVAVAICTFGANRNFLKGYYTTIGPCIGVPEGWEERSAESRQAVLEHELEHIEQCQSFGFGNAWVGLPLYTIFYLLLPLPIGFAYFRWRFERKAYRRGIETRLVGKKGHERTVLRNRLIDHAVEQLSSGKYGWTWPFPKSVRWYFEEKVSKEKAWQPLNTI